MLHMINRKLTMVYILDKLITIGVFLLCAISLLVIKPTVGVIIAIISGFYFFFKGYKDALLFLFDCLKHSKSTEFVYFSKVLLWDHYDWHTKLCYYMLQFYTNKQKRIVVIVPSEYSFDTQKGFFPSGNSRIEICFYKHSKVLDYWKYAE